MQRSTLPESGGIMEAISRFLDKLLPKPSKPDADVKATIIAPKDEGSVPYRIACEGTHSDIPDNAELWLIVHGQVEMEETGEAFDVFYPQPSPIMRLPGGTWNSVAAMGPDPHEPPGKVYDLLLVITTRGASRQLLKYAHESAARGKWSGMFSLPRGTTILDSVTLTRA